MSRPSVTPIGAATSVSEFALEVAAKTKTNSVGLLCDDCESAPDVAAKAKPDSASILRPRSAPVLRPKQCTGPTTQAPEWLRLHCAVRSAVDASCISGPAASADRPAAKAPPSRWTGHRAPNLASDAAASSSKAPPPPPSKAPPVTSKAPPPPTSKAASCLARTPIQEMEIHTDGCPYRIVQCIPCGKQLPQWGMYSHDCPANQPIRVLDIDLWLDSPGACDCTQSRARRQQQNQDTHSTAGTGKNADN